MRALLLCAVPLMTAGCGIATDMVAGASPQANTTPIAQCPLAAEQLGTGNLYTATCNADLTDTFCMSSGDKKVLPLNLSSCAASAAIIPMIGIWVEIITPQQVTLTDNMRDYTLSVVDAATGATVMSGHANYFVDLAKVPAGATWNVVLERARGGNNVEVVQINDLGYPANVLSDPAVCQRCYFGTTKLNPTIWGG